MCVVPLSYLPKYSMKSLYDPSEKVGPGNYLQLPPRGSKRKDNMQNFSQQQGFVNNKLS